MVLRVTEGADRRQAGKSFQTDSAVIKLCLEGLRQSKMDTTTYWYWEGNIVDALARHLAAQGWSIDSKADTRSKARGVDIQASKNGGVLLIEVKGYPSKEYRDPLRAAETKRTAPSSQAQQWYSHALLAALRLQTKNPAARVALAFADFPRYRTLFDETRGGLERLGVDVFMIRENGEVWEWKAT